MKYAIFVLCMLFTGCAASSDRWTGSVDAVFRYRPKEQSTVVFKVRPGSASKEAKLEPGDVLLKVDGVDVSNVSYEEIREALRGPVGTSALLSVKRGSTTVEIKVERKRIKSDSGGD